jgi:glutamate-ammonia-ligase adenylyltransferase
MRAEFAAVTFRDPLRAEANLFRIAQKLPPGLMAPLASLLGRSPDPDGALNLLERWAEAASGENFRDIAQFPTALTYLVAIFGYSAYLAETFLAEPGLALQFARDRNFTKLKSKEDLMQDFARFATTNPDPWLSAQLARWKRRHYLRIVLKDVLGLSTLGETTVEISALADVMLSNALMYCDQELEKRYGQPQYRDAQGRIARAGFSILSLGKLGGNELNYSSDIDLLFLYSHDGETSGGSESSSVITNKEYFVRLAHAITRTITQSTPHGMMFRVDLRLRPEGDQGDLAISLKSALEYYEHRARDWELQMLIKARHSAGDAKLTRAFLHGVDSYIYQSASDFEAIESVLWAREKISKKLRESGDDAVDVKLHQGGIRDIEFLTQCLQRLHGGEDPWVRSGGTLFALRKLNDKAYLSDRDFAVLTSAYEFLRRVEHRIQLEMGQQSHRLPLEREALDRLARRVGIEPQPPESPSDALLRQVHDYLGKVTEIYQRVIHQRSARAGTASFVLQPSPAEPGDYGPYSLDGTLEFLDSQAPALAAVTRQAKLADRARKNVTRFFGAQLATSESFQMLRDAPERLRRALEVIGTSDFLGEWLIHHPEDLAALDATLPAGAGEAEKQLTMALAEPPGHAVEPFPWALEAGVGPSEKMALLRRTYRQRALALGAADLSGMNSILGSLGQWSALASRSIASAFAMTVMEEGSAWQALVARYEGKLPFAILGLGRLGLSEFDLASDADLIFVTSPELSRDDLFCCTRLAESMIAALSSYTRDGMVFAVDTRLRPRGGEGELVITSEGLIQYIQEAAQVWEALTYLKLCPVGGDVRLGEEITTHATRAVVERFGSYSNLLGELRAMRRRQERELLVPPSNTKTAPGGYYDIDFAISALRLRHRLSISPGANSAGRIEALRAAGVIAEEDARVLREGAAFLRSVDHAVRLVRGKASPGLPEHVGHAAAVEDLARRWGLTREGESLATRLRATQELIRATYLRLTS